MNPETQLTPKLSRLPKIKQSLLSDVRKYLQANKDEVLQLEIIDEKTRINGDFFDDFLGERVLAHTPIDLKDILDLCLEEPMIIADLSRFTIGEPTTLMIIKDAIRYYLKDFVYRQIADLISNEAIF